MLPAFTKEKGQLSAKEVLDSGELVRVHIHVERLIGRNTPYWKAFCQLILLKVQVVIKAYQTN